MVVNNEKIVQTVVETLLQECPVDYPKMTQN